jgi:hypothetical protein
VPLYKQLKTGVQNLEAQCRALVPMVFASNSEKENKRFGDVDLKPRPIKQGEF